MTYNTADTSVSKEWLTITTNWCISSIVSHSLLTDVSPASVIVSHSLLTDVSPVSVIVNDLQ
jgi:hypothetical protein